jgi:hypothetical protein
LKSAIIPDIKHAGELATRIWRKLHAALFFVFLIIIILIGGYIWQQSVYNGQWSSEKQQTYLNSQNNGVVFKEADFQKVLNEMQVRKNEISKEPKQLKDIFKPY